MGEATDVCWFADSVIFPSCSFVGFTGVLHPCMKSDIPNKIKPERKNTKFLRKLGFRYVIICIQFSSSVLFFNEF